MPATPSAPQSMTAFASRTGQSGAVSWAWDIRGVNARGLDLRLRLPDGLGALETMLRRHLSARLRRGNVSLALRLTEDTAARAMTVDPDQLDRVLQALEQVQERAMSLGFTLAQPTAADVLAQRGVIGGAPDRTAGGDTDGATPDGTNTEPSALIASLEADFAPLLDEFCGMRTAEGAALATVLAGQIDEIARLVDAAAVAAEARRPETRAALTAALSRVLEDADVAEDRLLQELALLAVKADVTEEIDRLRGHVAAAQSLLVSAGPQGRKLDFLAQEFNREANTLCAKAGSAPLTALGLDLKAAIEQMREQIQNVE